MPFGDAYGSEHGDRWRYRATASELAAALTRLGIDVMPLSPLRGFVESGGAVTLTSVWDERLRTDPRLRLALLTMAGPVRLLTVAAHRRDITQGVLFIVGDSAGISCAIADDVISFSPPMSGIDLAALIRTFIDPPDSDDRPLDLVPANLLPTLAQLVSIGLRDGVPTDISEVEAAAAVRTGMGPDCDPVAGVRALQDDGVLATTTTGLGLAPEWLQRYAYLVDQERIELVSVELADVAAGYRASRELSIVGAAGRQRLALKRGGLNAEDAVYLAPLTAPLLTAAVLALIAPPRVPRAARRDGERIGLTAWPVGGRDDGPAGQWQTSPPAELLAGLVDGDLQPVSDAILRPRAQLSITSRREHEPTPRRSIVALNASTAVEWMLDGSRIRWRSLGHDGLDTVLRDLLPHPSESATGGEAAPIRLSSAEFADLIAGAGSDDASPSLPESLRELHDGTRVTWCAIEASSQAQGSENGGSLWLAYGEQGALWRFTESSDGVMASTVTRDQVGAEILAAIADGRA